MSIKNNKNNNKNNNKIEDENENENEEKLLKLEYKYPDPIDKNIQYKLYKKREFFFHKIKERPNLNNYIDIKEYRDGICDETVKLFDYQTMLSNFINPDTPYKGLLLFHNVGTGKTCSGIAIAEKFKPLVQRYNTKIHILVNGPLLKENWKNHLIKCTGETYEKMYDKNMLLDEQEKQKQLKNAINNALQYYRFMSFRSFYKRVLGEKIIEKKVVEGDKVKLSYKKTTEGEFERDLVDEKLHNLNNTLLIVDEAHNLTNNNFGDALKTIIKNSKNLKIILLTATPMKNLADDIIELLNFIRPVDSPIERDKMFNNPDKNYELELKPNGMEYFKNMARGYISHIRGADPLTYAKRIDKGEIPPGLLFTKVIRCEMSNFQKYLYNLTLEEVNDSLDRRSEAVSNFAFPGLTSNKKNITGYFGKDGISVIKHQITSHYELLNKKIGTDILNNTDESDFIYLTPNNRISGKIFNEKYLKYFSTKFYACYKKISRLVYGKKGPKTAFIYSNLVKVGIELFQEILLQNGYLEYNEDSNNYRINNNTRCYLCGKTYEEHANMKYDTSINLHEININGGYKYDEDIEDIEETEDTEDTEDKEDNKKINTDKYDDDTDSNNSTKMKNSSNIYIKSKKDKIEDKSSSEKSEYIKNQSINKIPKHNFHPATFISITGKADDTDDYETEEQSNILKNVFNNIENKNGKNIKFVLGSKVMNEGISLKNIGEVHILDVHFNLGRVDQVVGRGIRFCSHYSIMNEENKFPSVNVYKYVVKVDNGLSTEELLYQKSEMKYMLIKKIERVMKEIAIDCPLNEHGNMFEEEIHDYKDCGEKGKEPCPSICDYTKCSYKCDDVKLNTEFYDPKRKLYKTIAKNNLDYSTFTKSLARNEIDFSKNKIKELYLLDYIYTLDEIINHVKQYYDDTKLDLFDEFFIYKALDELLPISENEFNNFKDTILDKYNKTGYLIYINKYYIFQPFDQNENITMDYRTNFNSQHNQKISLYNYLKNSNKYNKIKTLTDKNKLDDNLSITELFEDKKSYYNFDDVLEYYENRNEFKYVGIIDKEMSRKKSKHGDELKDVFKIREKRSKILDKKRAVGIFSFFGSVCTSKEKDFIINVAKELDIQLNKNILNTKDSVCNSIRDKLALLEKYSTGKNKMTYLIIPSNHPEYPFPYNLEDRKNHIISNLEKEIKYNFNYNITENKKDKYLEYTIIIKDNEKLKEYYDILNKYKFKHIDNKWICEIN
jgi:hypothetical protein